MNCCPTIVAACVTASILGWNADRGWLIAVLAASFVVRAGWPGLRPGGDVSEVSRFEGVVAGVWPWVWLFVPERAWWFVVVGAIGLIGLARRIRRLDERSLADAVRRRDGGP